jgi:transposase
MDHIGIDLHKKESQICILRAESEPIEQRVRTTPARFADVLGDRPRARILLEASTESEWVARCLERLGHEVIAADPNFALMYATRTRTIKTDRRDARALTETCRLGAYRPAHRLSDAQRHARGRVTVRDALVRTRTVYLCDSRPAPAARLARARVRKRGNHVVEQDRGPAPLIDPPVPGFGFIREQFFVY